MGLLVDVHQAARFLGCSERRVRALLLQGRLFGMKQRRTWCIPWPLNLTAGTRGPDLKGYPVRKLKKPAQKPAQRVSAQPGCRITEGVLKTCLGGSDAS